MNNKYFFRSRISEVKFKQIVKLFSEDLMATQTANILAVCRVSINRMYGLIRQKIAWYCQQQSPYKEEIEVDKSYFGARRVKGKKGRGAYGKTIVFGILDIFGK